MANSTVADAIDKVADGSDLSHKEAGAVLHEIMSGSVSEVQTAGFLIALRTKGETVEEIVGLAETMRAMATRVEIDSTDLLDTAGTGGGASTFNVSTAAAFVASGAGVRVAKHGNRSATSLCGSADVLEALGARIDLPPTAIAQCIEEVGFGFMFAPAHHAATRYVVPVRKELAVRTIFNFLGPLTNPAGAKLQLVGVSDAGYLKAIAETLCRLGTERALVVSSDDGLDEVSVSSVTRVVEVSEGETRQYKVSPSDLGLDSCDTTELKGGDPAENAETVRSVLSGSAGPKADLVLANAAAALYVAGKAASLPDGVELARATIDSGAALSTLESFVAKTNEL